VHTAAEQRALGQMETSWRSEAWLHAYPLHAGTVLDYFKESDWYDRTCNNEMVRMQQRKGTDRLAESRLICARTLRGDCAAH